jgi:hypothetical protein
MGAGNVSLFFLISPYFYPVILHFFTNKLYYHFYCGKKGPEELFLQRHRMVNMHMKRCLTSQHHQSLGKCKSNHNEEFTLSRMVKLIKQKTQNESSRRQRNWKTGT